MKFFKNFSLLISIFVFFNIEIPGKELDFTSMDLDKIIERAKYEDIEMERYYKGRDFTRDPQPGGLWADYNICADENYVYLSNRYENNILILNKKGIIKEIELSKYNYYLPKSVDFQLNNITKSFLFYIVEDKDENRFIIKFNKNWEIQETYKFSSFKIIDADRDYYYLYSSIGTIINNKFIVNKEFNYYLNADKETEKKFEEQFKKGKKLAFDNRPINENFEYYTSYCEDPKNDESDFFKIIDQRTERVIKKIRNKKYLISPFWYFRNKIYSYLSLREKYGKNKKGTRMIGIIDKDTLKFEKIVKFGEEGEEILPIALPIIGLDGNFYYFHRQTKDKIYLRKVILNDN